MGKRIYLDYAASTPLDPQVEKVFVQNLRLFGNPGSLHSFGQEALAIIDEARLKIANFFGVHSSDVIFTGSATEANNLALSGVVKFFRQQKKSENLHIISSQIEHDSVLKTLKDLEAQGVAVTYLPVSSDGRIRVQDVSSFLRRETILVSIMTVNNETGVIQPIEDIGRIIRNFRRVNNSIFPLFHTDAVQAVSFEDCQLDHLGVDFLTFSGHKIYAPKGVAGLILKKGTPLAPIILGGGQEDNRRSGTENAAAIGALAEAVNLIRENKKDESHRLEKLRKKFVEEIMKNWPRVIINSGAAKTAPHIINVRFPGQKSDELLVQLDLAGVAISAGSACSARALEPSHVLLAMGLSDEQTRASIRFSLGRFTTEKEIEEVLKILKKIIK
ncbi:MAG TPA: cysteine desulfurase family protein [Candidatus Paceibacterota bacterium]|nr:cysteine desulfurase family protein [Candidatus Paceibacterota bacterium]